ncbi:Mov34/MPN/PAD-1 family protein [Paenibacillus thiaminolyticus]|uniref:JAB domain-containing protein n=1 Tax=Paenibacillus thiaminolyticus TaxID=49283 RepID=A0A3A3GF16_PANTH|nr:Mov34/MPN/PAD-1 family protein [Paenibacillus thiaminolyticus]RJG21372.1 hypothetical protein DQX05_21990 [Paenibacillus thiaminolyticus]
MSFDTFIQLGLFEESEVTKKKEVKQNKTVKKPKSADTAAAMQKKSSKYASMSRKDQNIEVDMDFTVHYASRSFLVSDLIEEVPESGKVTLDQVREGLFREYYEFTASRTKWDYDLDQKRLYPFVFMEKMGSLPSAIRSFHWTLDDYEENKLEKPVQIIASRNGDLIECRETEYVKVKRKARQIRELDLINEGVELKLKKIPIRLLNQIVSFFRVYSEKSLEVLVYLLFDHSTEAYEVFVPCQEISTYEVRSYVSPDELLYKDIVMVIHSHHQMEAKFSEIDDINDQALRISGVIGHLTHDKPSVQFRTGFNGTFFSIRIEDLFEDDGSTLDHRFPSAWTRRIISN